MENQNNNNLNQPATQQDIQDLKTTTKQDIQDLKATTQQDIQDLKATTKQDIQDFKDKAFETFATKEDIKNLPTKEDMKGYVDEILEAKEEMIGKMDDALTEFKMKSASDLRRDEELEDHEERITHIETKIGVVPA